jgi:RimJ/RimL family protein N-acetyltransferase
MIGLISLMRMQPGVGVIEIGWVVFSPLLQRTRGATETIFLLLRHCFDLGYRRVEWKCDSLNAPSRAAAERFGFSYEGTFKKCIVYKGRSRDTAWFAVVHDEWDGYLRSGYERWLADENHDETGQQRRAMREFHTEAKRLRADSRS